MNKVCVFIVALVAVTGNQAYPNNLHHPDDVEPYGLIEDTINKTIQGVLANIPDPIVISDLQIDLPGGALLGALRINAFQLSGLGGIQLTKLKVNVLSLSTDFTIVVPNTNLNTNYWANVILADFLPLYGEGKANIHLGNLELQVTGKLDLSKGIQIKNFKVVLSIDDATFDIHGMLNNEDFSLIVSTILNDTVAKFINEQQKIISLILSPLLETLFNSILGGAGQPTTPAP